MLSFRGKKCDIQTNAHFCSPSSVYDALNVPEADRQEVLQQELAVALYEEGILSFGKARELAGLSRREFHRLLGDREVSRHYTSEELEYARS